MIERFVPRTDELLWKKFNLDWATLQDLRHEPDADAPVASADERKARLERCQYLLEEAKTCLTEKRGGWFYGRNSDMFWAAIHQADEELILLMGRDRLAVAAIDLKDDFDRSMSDPLVRGSWLADDVIPKLIRDLKQPPPSAGTRYSELNRQRHFIRAALHQLNEKTDQDFWRLAMNTRVRVWSAAVFVALMVVVLLCSGPLYNLLWGSVVRDFWHRIAGLTGLFGLGAASAILSNMLSGQKINVPYGPTQTVWAVFYYLVVVPLVGAAAAGLLAAFVKSDLLFSLHEAGQSPNHTLVSIVVARDARPFAYIVIVAMGGFLGERVLRSTFQRVYEAMFREADKDTASRGR